MKVGLPLIKNVLTPLAKSVLVINGGSVSNRHSYSKGNFGSGTTILIFSIEELNNITKILKSVEDSRLLIKGITETVENKVKEQKGGFLGMLEATLVSTIVGNMLAGKCVF